MSTTYVADIDDTAVSTLSWGAVVAGAVTSAALTLFLAALGVGLGLSTISPWAGEGVTATTFKVGAGVYLVAVAMLAGTVGGYVAGRLRTKWVGVNDHEIYFRDTAHGLVVWALATVLTASALGAVTSHILASASGGLTAGATASAFSSNPTEATVDALLRADPASSNTTPATPSISSSSGDANATARGELGRLLVPALQRGGDLAPADRAYVAKVVSARTGLSQADADKRVSDVVARAKQAADDARSATASLMLWFAGSMLAGALASMLGATEGGLLRDSKWYEPGWRKTVTRTH